MDDKEVLSYLQEVLKETARTKKRDQN
jgi:hypothetical protein